MQKILIPSTRVMAFALLVAVLPSCKKELCKKPFDLTTKTFYRISPIAPEPVTVNGVSFVSSAFFPGGGTGNAKYLGEITTFFNQQVYAESAEAPPLGSVPAPLTDIPFYPITGAPLPLIQPTDFTALTSIISSLRIPETVHGRVVSTLIYNQRGDAVFISALSGTSNTFPISQTIIGFNGKALIVGGRGRFSNAVGEIDYEGRFSLVDPNDASYDAEGWIDF